MAAAATPSTLPKRIAAVVGIIRGEQNSDDLDAARLQLIVQSVVKSLGGSAGDEKESVESFQDQKTGESLTVRTKS
jgi:hypothetical protein